MAKGCTSCKKKPAITSLPKVEEEMFIPTVEDIKLAYAELTSNSGVKEDKKEFISKVYQYLFEEPFDFGCRSCGKPQARRFYNHMKNILKLI
jgi:hypothetical protein